jgi:hypothetical protein
MTTIKITKKDMVEAITEYLSAQGQRMTNLKKASEDQLKSLVEEYEINIQEFAKNRKEEMKKQRAIDKKAKEKRDEEQRERDRKRGERIDEIRKLSSVLDLDIFRLRQSIQKQLLDTIHYRNNKAEIDAENESNKEMCDREFKCFQREQSLGTIRLLERVDDYTIRVNGMNVSYGYKVGVETHEFYINWSKNDSDIDLFENVCKAGLLPTIAEQYKLYINGKANWIVEKQNRRRISVDTWGETQTIMPNEVFKFIADKLTDKQIAEVNEFIIHLRFEKTKMETCWKCETKIDTEKDKGWEYCSCLDAHFCSRCSPTNTCFCECDGSCDCANCLERRRSVNGGIVKRK